ncbi:sodium/potassium-transporting ATPase subunit gamma isoform X1 [Paroedura picta]|uniref:sodium/potassium-transporting ATPase subunit gamma isoform X1 n=1 Tax=Paroedura picta TaxID=143630 RepID=UPI0040563E95
MVNEARPTHGSPRPPGPLPAARRSGAKQTERSADGTMAGGERKAGFPVGALGRVWRKLFPRRRQTDSLMAGVSAAEGSRNQGNLRKTSCEVPLRRGSQTPARAPLERLSRRQALYAPEWSSATAPM